MWVYPVLESIIALRTTSSIMHRSVLVQSYFFPPGIGFQTLIKRIVHFFHERVKGLQINILKKESLFTQCNQSNRFMPRGGRKNKTEKPKRKRVRRLNTTPISENGAKRKKMYTRHVGVEVVNSLNRA